MSMIAWCRSAMRGALLGAALVLVFSAPLSVAQSVPVLGYVAAKNANPKRLEVFKQGLTELGYVEGKNIEGYYGAAKYVDKILRGANPADLPIAGPTQFTFSVSRSALAKSGLSLPAEITVRVNEWVN